MSDLVDRVPAILEQVDLPSLVERYAGPGRHSGGRWTFRCPHPDHADNSPSFTVKDGRWRCWSQCGEQGDAIDLIVWLDGVSKAEAIDRLGRGLGLVRPDPRRDEDLVALLPKAAPAAVPADAEAILARFLTGRRWDADAADQLGLAVVTDSYGHHRIRFPFTPAGSYWQDRAVGPTKLRWLSPSGPVPYPYNAHSLTRARSIGACFIVEGISDAVAILHDFPEAAVIGVPGSGGFRQSWAAPLAGLSVYVVADNDPAGEKMRAQVEEHLAGAAEALWHVRVPEAWPDVDSWRASDPAAFPDRLYAAVDALDGELALGVAS